MANSVFQIYRNVFTGLSRDVWLLSSVTFVNRAGAMVIPFLTVYLTQDLGFSMVQTGYIMSYFGFGSMLGALIGGWLTDRIGYYRVMLFSLFGGGMMFLILEKVESFWPLCLTIFTLSAIAYTLRPAAHTAISVYSRPENLTRSYSISNKPGIFLWSGTRRFFGSQSWFRMVILGRWVHLYICRDLPLALPSRTKYQKSSR